MMDPFNMHATLAHKSIEIERAVRVGQLRREARNENSLLSVRSDRGPSIWQQLVDLFRSRPMREAPVE